MTDASTATEAVFAPGRRPVARFVAAIALAAAVLIATWATGVGNPRIELTVERWERRTPGSATLAVHNDGLAPARVKVVGAAGPFVRLVRQSPQLGVGSSGRVRLTVLYVVDCAAYARAANSAVGATSPSLHLRVRARGPIGTGRTVTWPRGDEITLGDVC